MDCARRAGRGCIRHRCAQSRRSGQRRMARRRCRVHLLHRLSVLWAVRGQPGARDRSRAGNPGLSSQRRSRLCPDQPIRPLRPSFRGDRRRRSLGWAGAGRANGLSPGHAVDSRGRGVRRRGPGHDGSVSVDAARWPLARRYRACRDGAGCGHDHGHRHPADLRHHPCGPRPGRGQGADRQPVGDVRGGLHDPDRAADGDLQSVHPSRPRRRKCRSSAACCCSLR